MAVKMVNLKITWEYISMVVKASECTNGESQESGLAVSASMALSFIMAGTIGDELFLVYNWQLQSAEEKRLLLQSTQSHLLRMKLTGNWPM